MAPRCIGIDNGQRCPDRAVQAGAGLLCDVHRKALWQGKLSVLTGLRSSQLTKLLALKGHKSGAVGGGDGGTSAILSTLTAPVSLVTLASPPALAIFERLWRNWMAFDLPPSPSGSGANVFLSAELYVLIAGFFILYLLFLVLLALILYCGVRFGIVFSFSSVTSKWAHARLWSAQLSHWLARRALRGAKRMDTGKRLTTWDIDSFDKRARQTLRQFNERAQARKSTYRETRKSARARVRDLLRWLWQALLAQKGASWSATLYRLAVIVVLAAFFTKALQVQTDKLKVALAQSDERCETIYMWGKTGAWLAQNGLSIVRSFPCGRIAFSRSHDVLNPALVDNAVLNAPVQTQVSVPLHHLGRYDDWAVLSPTGAGYRPVLVKSAMIREFGVEVPDVWMQPDMSHLAGGLREGLSRMVEVAVSIWRRFIEPQPERVEPDMLQVQTNLNVQMSAPPQPQTKIVVYSLPNFASTGTWQQQNACRTVRGEGTCTADRIAARREQAHAWSQEVELPAGQYPLLMQLARRFEIGELEACRKAWAQAHVAFANGSAAPAIASPIRAFANQVDALASVSDHVVILVSAGFAERSKISPTSLAGELDVETRLMAAILNIPIWKAQAKGPAFLAEKNISILSTGISPGTELPIGSQPAQFELRMCPLARAEEDG